MKIVEKISILKKTIQEIKNISMNLEKATADDVYEKKIIELNKEILNIKKEVNKSVEELEELLKDKNA